MTPGALIAAGALLVVGVIALDLLAGRVMRPAQRLPERTVPELGMDHEDLTIPSGDHELAAWLLRSGPGPSHGPLCLLAHGWGASYGTVLELGEPLAKAGHDVLLFDVRGHGRNEPVPYVTARHFREDVIAVARYAAERFPDRQLVVIGHSLGGAAAVLAAADGAPLDGLVLIAAPSDVMKVTAKFLSDKGMPGGLMVIVLRPFFWRRIGGTFRSLTPGLRIRELDLPILIIQPEHDVRVTRDHADHLAEAAGIEYNLIARGHIDVLSAPETLRLVQEFLEEL